MSAETNILDRLKVDLGYIHQTNSYANKSKYVYEGRLDLTKLTDFDVICFYLGATKPMRSTNSGMPIQWELEIYIHTLFKSEKGESKLVRKGESWIEDFRKWFYRDSSIAQNKWFTLDQEPIGTPAVTGLSNVAWNSRRMDEIERFAIWEKDVGEIIHKLTINYSI